MKVLFGVDGSETAAAAVCFGGRLLAEGKNLVAVYFSPPHLAAAESERPDAATVEHLRNVLAERVFEEASRELPATLRESLQAIVGVQNPAHGLLVAADELRVDLIVVGAQGAGIAKGGLGRVARHVTNHATVPVLIVRPEPDSQERPLRVLLANDGSEGSQHTGEFLRNFTWTEDAIGHVMWVIDSLEKTPVAEWMEECLGRQEAEAMGLGAAVKSEAQQQRLRECIRRRCGELPRIFDGQEPRIAVGNPAREILQAIEHERIDLVVIGAHRFGAFTRRLLGSTSERVLTHAPCSVLIVRRHERP
jgi:nucleotide-binding universal stress UspA family protein